MPGNLRVLLKVSHLCKYTSDDDDDGGGGDAEQEHKSMNTRAQVEEHKIQC